MKFSVFGTLPAVVVAGSLGVATGASAPVGGAAIWPGGVGDWPSVDWLGLPPGVFPNDPAIAVLIDDGNAVESIVSVGGSAVNDFDVASLSVSLGDTIVFPNSRSITVAAGGFLHNDGVLRSEAGGGINFSGVRLAGDQMISGVGEIHFSTANNPGGSGNELRSDGGVITHGADHTIRGAGRVLKDTGGMINFGAIISGEPTGQLQVDPDENGFVQQPGAVLRADSPGGLYLAKGDYTNLGVMTAGSESVLYLGRGCEIFGGVLETTGTGEIRPAGFAPPHVTDPPILHDVTISPGSLVVLPASQTLELTGGLVNDGGVRLIGATEVRCLESLTLGGAGGIRLDDGGAAVVVHDTAGPGVMITNGPDHTIQGRGRVLNDSGGMINSGQIIADDPSGHTLTVRPADDQMVLNENLMIARTGGVLVINDGVIDGVGAIVAEPLGVVRIIDATVRHNTLGPLADVGGVVELHDGAVLENVTIPDAGAALPVLIAAGWDPTVVDTLTNDHVIRVEGSGTLRHADGATLTGTGAVHLTDSFSTVRPLAGGVMTHAAGHLIHGRGRILANDGGMTNFGEISADDLDGPLTIDSGAGHAFVNENLAEARAGGVLRFLNGDVINNGAILAADDGLVEISNTTVVGGEIGNTPSSNGQVRLMNDAVIDDVTIALGSVTPAVRVSGDVFVRTALDIRNAVIIEPNATMFVLDGATVDGNGTSFIEMQHVFSEIRTDGTTMVHGADGLIFGKGRILGNSGGMDNHGRIAANDPDVAMTIDPGADLAFTNFGTLETTGGATLRVLAGAFENRGLVEIDAAGLLDRNGDDYLQTDGLTTVRGTLDVDNGDIVDLQGGRLTGDGLIDGDVVSTAGVLDPGDAIGPLTIDGAYSQLVDAELRIDVGTDSADTLAVSDLVSLNGRLVVTLADGAAPGPGTEFDVLLGEAISGGFSEISVPDGVEVSYAPGVVRLTINLPPKCGDLDGDDIVGAPDLAALLSEWGGCDDETCPADLDRDGVVGPGDLATLLGDWGVDCSR